MRDWPAAIDAAFAKTSNVPATVSSSTTNNPQSLSSWNSACSSNVRLLISVNSRFLRSSKLTENSKSMAAPVQLHPKIRVRPKARLSAAALAEFIITTPDKQDDVLHDAVLHERPPAPRGLRGIETAGQQPGCFYFIRKYSSQRNICCREIRRGRHQTLRPLRPAELS